jgi:hypothetical protein
MTSAAVKLEKEKFCFALGLWIYRIIVALQATINLNHFAASERSVS